MKIKQTNSKGKNVNGFLSAIISGILTEMVADELLKPSYEITKIEEGFSIQAVSTLAFWQIMLILFGAFMSIWLLINYGIPFFIRQIKKIRYQKTKNYSIEQIVSDFREYEIVVKTIYASYSQTHDIESVKIDSIELFQKLAEIENEIISFENDNDLTYLFRRSNELCTLRQYLSRYEIVSCLSQSEILIKDMERLTGNDLPAEKELKDDCARAKAIIDYLKEMTK